MSAIALTSNNVHFVKRALRQHYSSVKSSHLSEALAAACGYRTHATLLSDIPRSKGLLPDIARVSEDRFFERLKGFGYKSGGQQLLSTIIRSPELPERIWCERKGRDIPALEIWDKECTRRDIPHVYVMVRRKYALLNWDCITLDEKHDNVTKGKKSAALVRAMYEHVWQMLKPSTAIFDGSAFTGEIDPLLPETARDIADEICIMLYRAVRSEGTTNEPSGTNLTFRIPPIPRTINDYAESGGPKCRIPSTSVRIPRPPITDPLSYRPQNTEEMTDGQLAEYLAGTWDVIEDGGLGVLVEMGEMLPRRRR